ncbi:MAG TPA: undecaprenyl-diphosphate phosphatase [Steroidobacteraceae bacterium]|nr:undecaprenyl-diphosphate phosphatase [Steroidobacteraceae bacterium]
MSLLDVFVLAIVQGLAELLPVSSSAHVVVAEKLLGLDPSSPPMTLLLVMLHTGTMFAVIVYFWTQWRAAYFGSAAAFKAIVVRLIGATLITAVVYEAIVKVLERTVLRGLPHSQIEDLFGHLELIAPALAAAGILILIAGVRERRARARPESGEITLKEAGIIGLVQGFCVPFRGFSRSGATISTGMLIGVSKPRAERFSFALAVVLTPAAVFREVSRLMHASALHASLQSVALRGVLGAVLAFLAGLVALRWLSRWLESGRWYLFGVYCLIAAVGVALLHYRGF